MSSPDSIAAPDATSPAVTRRSRPRWRLLTILTVIVGLAFATSACTKMTPQEAVKQHWGRLSDCADKIVTRESGYNPDAVNRSSGAKGLFQLMPQHAKWIKATFGYDWDEMSDASKNAEVARELSNQAYRYWGDGWQPWRIGSGAKPGGGCPA